MSSFSAVPIRYLKGIGAKRARIFNKLGIYSIEDLLYYFPHRYEDRSRLRKISQCLVKEEATIEAKILALGQKESYKRRNFQIIQVLLGDETGFIKAVWFNQPYLKNCFKVNQKVILHGKVDIYNGQKQFTNPEFEIIVGDEQDSLSVGRIVPIYSLTEGLTQRFLRKVIKAALDRFISKITDPLPYNIRAKHNFLNLAQSLINIHFPQNQIDQKEAYRRLSFEEFFIHQIPVIVRKLNRKQKKGISHLVQGQIFTSLLKNLPFELTLSQKEALEDIKKDMASNFAMQRLLQGEVASGKTIIAILAACICLDGGYQVAFMVPTGILANQHYEKIQYFLSLIDKNIARRVNLALLTSNLTKKQRSTYYQEIREGEVNFVIGTHSLLQEDLRYKNLGLVIIDEQHKFGVAQRALLEKKADNPDVLILTATPIPRTLSLTLYGDLDVSVIRQLPPFRLPIKTIGYTKFQIEEVYDFVKGILKNKQQVYFVCPLIEDSEEIDIEAAEKIYQEYKTKIFKEFKIGLVHGKLDNRETEKIMDDFRQANIDILVATSILEVGIDVPNATCMVVLDAQRFGLSQLHQLRGRVGRGRLESFFLVVYDAKTDDAKMRIDAIINLSDGFKIAEEDLKIRGPGEYFGKRQHGLSHLKIANPLTQLHLLKSARQEAISLLKDDPTFAKRQNRELLSKIKKAFPAFPYLELVA